MQLVLSIVSERTGYPIDTLGVDLDLEADLSIDSIKRIEIIGELAQRLGLKVDGDSNADAVVEELATRKTLRALVAWLTERLAQPAAGAPAPIKSTIDTAAPIATADDADTGPIRTGATTGAQVRRYRLAIVPAPAPVNGYSTLAGQRIAICAGDDDVAIALEAKLFAEGATVRRVAGNVALGDELDGLVHLGRIDSIAAMRAQFERVREAALAGAKTILVVTAHGGFGQHAGDVLGGPAGLVKTVAAEFPAIRARVVDVEPGTADVAALVHAELHAHDAHFEIGYLAGERVTRELQPAPRELGRPPAFDAQSVVLVTGGARGITARTAIALAERYGCRIELVGRSPLPGVEPAELRAAVDAPALRRALAVGGATPAEIEKQCSRVLADREIRATLAALGERGTYHAVDVRAPEFAALLDELYRTRGRIDGVIHGAGVLDDKLMKQKTGEAFERVYATKVAGARTIADKLRADTKLVVLFSSIVGAFGNRGQADYAAAGDALDKLAWSLARKVTGRVVSIDWGPWAGAGMVSPELAREYARRGVDLIATEAGIAAVLDEIAAIGEPQVILSAADPRALWSRPATPAPAPAAVVESPAEN